ncbi:MAG: hypothetical protein HYR94_07245, partial [Chloroflexi bacterium]|nr:hypothetical protein [Chloroflexota bacterium]
MPPLFIFFTAFANPITAEIPLAGGSRPTRVEGVFLNQALSVASILMQTGFMMGVVLLAVRRWTLPFSNLTLVLTIQTLLSVWPHENYQLLPLVALSGLAADLLRWGLKPSAAHPNAFRLFAFSVPVGEMTELGGLRQERIHLIFPTANFFCSFGNGCHNWSQNYAEVDKTTSVIRQRNCSNEKDSTDKAKGSKRICLPIDRAKYEPIVGDKVAFRHLL